MHLYCRDESRDESRTLPSKVYMIHNAMLPFCAIFLSLKSFHNTKFNVYATDFTKQFQLCKYNDKYYKKSR